MAERSPEAVRGVRWRAASVVGTAESTDTGLRCEVVGGSAVGHRIRVLRGGLELSFPGRTVRPPRAPAEVGVLLLLALHPGRELAIGTFKVALFDVDPALVSDGAIHTPISRLRRAGLPIPPRRYVLDVDPSEVDIVDVDTRARSFIEAALHPERLAADTARQLVLTGEELHGLWRHDPAEAVGHRPLLSQLFDPYRRRHRRFGLALVRLLATTGETERAIDTLAEYVDRYGDDATSSDLRHRLREMLAAAPHTPGVGGYLTSPGEAVVWPVQVGHPPSRARAFQRRDAVIDQLTGLAAADGEAASQVVLVGSGGVGKTQLAAEAFARARAEGADLLVWVNASSRASILATYAHARHETEPSARAVDAAEAAEDFLGWLAVTARSWMIVLDDVADPADLRGFWPEGRGCVVATTRRRDVAPAGARQVPVDAFTPQEARSYLTERLTGTPVQRPHPQVLDEADELAAALGWLPVALAQAAAVILNEGITAAGYRRRVVTHCDLDRLFPSDARADDYAHTVAATWSLSVDLADRLPPAGLARPALSLAAVLDPNGAPETLWTTGPALRLLAATPEQARAALRNLHRLSLLNHEPGGGAQAVTIHALTQRAALGSLSAHRRNEVARAAADALAEVWPEPETDPGLARVLRQNLAALVRCAEDALWSPEGHEVLFLAGRSLSELGLARNAIDYWCDLAATAARRLGADHHHTLTIRHAVSDWYGIAGHLADAVAEHRQLLDDRTRILGADHADTLATRHGLAYWQGACGEPAGAVTALGQLCDDYRRALGPDHPDTLAAQHTLADWQGVAGDARGARRTFEQLVDSDQRAFGADHRTTLTTRRQLAYWQGASGDHTGAVSALEQLRDDCQRVLGPDHPDTLATRAALADWQGAAGDAAGAARAFQQLSDDCRRVLGPEHPDSFAARHGAADWQGAAGDAAGAAEGFERLSRERAHVLGADHPATLTSRAGSAYWQGVAGDAPSAVRLLHRVVEDRTRVLGPEHTDTFLSRHTLAHWQGVAGDPAGATGGIDALEQLHDDCRRVLGRDHPHTLGTRLTLAYWQGVAGDPTGAIDALEQLRDQCRRVLGRDHPHTLAVATQLSSWREVADSDGEPAAVRRRLHVEQLRQLGPGRPHTLALRHGLADWRTGRLRRQALLGLQATHHERSAG